MTRRQRLTGAQIAELYDPPLEQHELVRHFTLSATDLVAIQCCRGDHNRLGFALMLCHLRFPGRPLRTGERLPSALLAFVAEQIDVLPESIDDYLAAERNRQRQATECQNRDNGCTSTTSDRGRPAFLAGGGSDGDVPSAADRYSSTARTGTALRRPSLPRDSKVGRSHCLT